MINCILLAPYVAPSILVIMLTKRILVLLKHKIYSPFYHHKHLGVDYSLNNSQSCELLSSTLRVQKSISYQWTRYEFCYY